MVRVKISQGWLEGVRASFRAFKGAQKNEQYLSFKGIPYAAPPVGNLRFKAPLPPLPWDGVRKATQHGPICPQVDVFTNDLLPGSEDCLYLNVYSPNIKPEKHYPVMVFIHGGGYKSGSGNDEEFGPEFLLSHDIILVTINYRLDALGFLCLDDKQVPGNAGLKDQLAALKWVQNNIEQFGGDPDNVTIIGQSAGGASATYHLLSSTSKGLFNRIIAMSGVAISEWTSSFESKKRAFAFGKQLGIYTNKSNELIEALQKVPLNKLVNLNTCVSASEEVINIPGKMFSFTPVVEKYLDEDHFLTENPENILKNGKINKADVMAGYTNNELVVLMPLIEKVITKFNNYPELLVPVTILNSTTPSKMLDISDKIREHYFNTKKPINMDCIKEFMKYFNETVITYKTERFINLLPTAGSNRKYFYNFCCSSGINKHTEKGLKYGLTGAAHTDDLLYLFNAKSTTNIDKNSKEYKLINEVCTLFTNFAKFGNPTPDSSLGIKWPEYDTVSKKHMNIGEKLTVETLNTESLEFLSNIYKEAGQEG